LLQSDCAGIGPGGLKYVQEGFSGFMSATNRDSSAPLAATDAGLAFQAALALRNQGKTAGADALCTEILRLDPRFFDALHLRGLIALDQGDLAGGIDFIQRSLAVNSDQAVAHSNLGNALLSAGEWQRARESFDRALSLKPDLIIAHYNRANALRSLGFYEQALAGYDHVLALNARHVPALNNHGLVLEALGRLDEARASLERARDADPRYAPAQENLAALLLKLDRPLEALAVSESLLKWAPGNVTALCTSGNSLLALARPEEAVRRYTLALEVDPGNFDALLNRGAAHQRLGHLEDALADGERALAAIPDSVRALVNCGNDHLGLGQADLALMRFERALLLAPEDCDALHGRGAALLKAGRDLEAAQAFADVLRLRPDHGLALEQLFHLRMNACDWRDQAWLPLRLRNSLVVTRSFANPLTLLMYDDPELAITCARAFASAKHPLDSGLGPCPPPSRRQGGKIRIAYVSADFHTHPVAQSLVGVLERHDRSRIEVLGISLRARRPGEFERRVHDAFDRYADVSAHSDRSVAVLMREWGVDIAVDLMGFTEGFRVGIFAHRAAPVQVGFLGYAGTVGAAYMDYILADCVVIPPESERWFAERVARVPHCYLPTDDRRVPVPAPTREQAGLPPHGLVLCAFTRAPKITPEVFDVWMRLLCATPGSVLWLREMGESARANLLGAAAARGVPAHRLVFAGHAPGAAEHLARQQLADLYLDTLPYNAHSTACDALWAGVPVLTSAGATFASRVAASALSAAGLPELITYGLDEYEQRARELLHEPQRLAELRSRLALRRSRLPLFETERYTRDLEAAYLRMYEQAAAGVPPASFDVGAVREVAASTGIRP
jgi:predicted O-linked N-acetylglucosamine transferase (SPINDLY family)